jgi:hypothetical protein
MGIIELLWHGEGALTSCDSCGTGELEGRRAVSTGGARRFISPWSLVRVARGGEIAFGVTAKVCEPLALRELLPFMGHKKNVDMIDSLVEKKN